MSASGSGQTKVVEILLQHEATVDIKQKVSTCDTASSSVWKYIRESVDSLCRDGVDTPIVRVHTKNLESFKRSRSKPFRTPSYPIPAFLYPTIPPK